MTFVGTIFSLPEESYYEIGHKPHDGGNNQHNQQLAHGPYALRGSGGALHNALDHHCGDAREHGLGLRGRQNFGESARSRAEDIPKLPWLLIPMCSTPLRIGRREQQRCRPVALST